MNKKIKKFFIGLVLLPLTAATLFRLPGTVLVLKSQSQSLAFLFTGALIYILFEGIFNRPMRTYVFGHELTHALASIAFGGKIHEFHVSEKGGKVSLTKTNFFVALAPYCFPIYTFFIFLLYWVFRKFHPFPSLETVFLISVGFSLAFHSSLTFFALRQEQPDLKKTGVFFSLVFILLMNGWVLVLISKALFWGEISLRGFVRDTVWTQFAIWKWVYAKAMALGPWLVHRSGKTG